MKKEHMADMLEEMDDHFEYWMMGWALEHSSDPDFKSKFDAIAEFRRYVQKQNEEDIVAQRPGGSYADVREIDYGSR